MYAKEKAALTKMWRNPKTRLIITFPMFVIGYAVSILAINNKTWFSENASTWGIGDPLRIVIFTITFVFLWKTVEVVAKNVAVTWLISIFISAVLFLVGYYFVGVAVWGLW